MLTVSLSAYQAWQRCEQKYKYQYVDRLRPLVKSIAPQRGVILHEYLAAYYRALKENAAPIDAHNAGLDRIDAYEPMMKAAAQTTFLGGDEDEAEEYSTLIPTLKGIADRYYDVRGLEDAKTYDVLLVEERIRTPLTNSIRTMSIVDLVLRARKAPNLTWLVEHKSVKNVPDTSVRIRDFQTLLYATTLARPPYDLQIDGILWNYLRTKEPSIPFELARGGLSKAKNLDTTWQVYQSEIERLGLDVADYLDVRDRLRDKEETAFFPRYNHVIVADYSMLMDDYVMTAARIQAVTARWAAGQGKPIRALSRDCDYCQYYKLCEAAIVGGDESDIVRLYFTNQREEEPA